MRRGFVRAILLYSMVFLIWFCGLYGYAFLRNLIRPDDWATVEKIETEAIRRGSLMPAVWVSMPKSLEEQDRFNKELNEILALKEKQPRLATKLMQELEQKTKLGGRYYPVWSVPLFVSEAEAWSTPVVMAPKSLVADPVETISRRPWAVFLAALTGTVITMVLWHLICVFRVRRLCRTDIIR